jgi:ABC-type branched-subunit amino acid transport system substrate-binding protein
MACNLLIGREVSPLSRCATSLRVRFALAVLLPCAAPAGDAACQAATEPPVTVIGVVEPTVDTARSRAFRRGVELGIAEAVRAGELLGRRVRLAEVPAGLTPARTADTVRSLGALGVVALVTDASTSADLTAAAQDAGVPLVMVGEGSTRGCARFVFRIAVPADSAAASLLSSAAGPVVMPTDDSPLKRLGLALWHPALERFGAAQLTDRFRARYGEAMDSDSWAGWMAVKIVWESSLRAANHTDGLRDAIARGAFDGHKGKALRFGPDGVLQQPLIIVRRGAGASSASDSVVAEVPWPQALSGGAGSAPDSALLTGCRDLP